MTFELKAINLKSMFSVIMIFMVALFSFAPLVSAADAAPAQQPAQQSSGSATGANGGTLVPGGNVSTQTNQIKATDVGTKIAPVNKAVNFILGAVWVVLLISFVGRMFTMFQQQNYAQLIATVAMFAFAAWVVVNPMGIVELLGKLMGGSADG